MAANYSLAPFTGRNLYLQGLNSKSNVVESVMLLLCLIDSIAFASASQLRQKWSGNHASPSDVS